MASTIGTARHYAIIGPPQTKSGYQINSFYELHIEFLQDDPSSISMHRRYIDFTSDEPVEDVAKRVDIAAAERLAAAIGWNAPLEIIEMLVKAQKAQGVPFSEDILGSVVCIRGQEVCDEDPETGEILIAEFDSSAAAAMAKAEALFTLLVDQGAKIQPTAIFKRLITNYRMPSDLQAQMFEMLLKMCTARDIPIPDNFLDIVLMEDLCFGRSAIVEFLLGHNFRMIDSNLDFALRHSLPLEQIEKLARVGGKFTNDSWSRLLNNRWYRMDLQICRLGMQMLLSAGIPLPSNALELLLDTRGNLEVLEAFLNLGTTFIPFLIKDALRNRAIPLKAFELLIKSADTALLADVQLDIIVWYYGKEADVSPKIFRLMSERGVPPASADALVRHLCEQYKLQAPHLEWLQALLPRIGLFLTQAHVCDILIRIHNTTMLRDEDVQALVENGSLRIDAALYTQAMQRAPAAVVKLLVMNTRQSFWQEFLLNAIPEGHHRNLEFVISVIKMLLMRGARAPSADTLMLHVAEKCALSHPLFLDCASILQQIGRPLTFKRLQAVMSIAWQDGKISRANIPFLFQGGFVQPTKRCLAAAFQHYDQMSRNELGRVLTTLGRVEPEDYAHALLLNALKLKTTPAELARTVDNAIAILDVQTRREVT